MKKCLYSRRRRNIKVFGLVGFLVLGAVNAIPSTITLLNNLTATFSTIITCLLWLAIGLGFVVLAVLSYFEDDQEYFVNSWGITVYYNKSCRISYSWEDIQSICVCDIDHAAKDYNVFTVVIRLVHGEEKNGPFSENQQLDLSGLERWRSYEYNILHRKNVIIVEYSDERLKEIEDLSGKNIYYFLTERAKDRGWYEDENGDHHLLNSKD